MITVYIKKIENITENEKQNIIGSLSKPALERLNKKRNEELFFSSLCALALLRDEQQSDLDYTENGRPFFTTLNADISISHSKTHAAVAISNSRSINVGIDVEDAESVKISPRFLTENEKKDAINEQKFIEIWTKKEALFKFLKNDSTTFIKLDSTTPEKYDAHFATVKIDNSIITICASENEKIEILQK